MRHALATIIVTVLVLGTAAAASGATPAAYRASLNRMCRSYTPALTKLQAAMTAAEKRKDGRAYGIYLGEALVLTLQQDGRIERTPVPAPLRATMTPIIRTLKLADAHIRLAVDDALRSNSTGMLAELKKVAAVAGTMNQRLDRAGLRDCGSNQA